MRVKRGQITLFIVLGIVILIAALFLMYTIWFKGDKVQQNQKPEQQTDLDNYMISCLQKISDPLINEIASKGGTFVDMDGKSYFNHKYNYLCKYMINRGCMNLMITRETMESELNQKIKIRSDECKLDPFKLEYKVTEGKKDVKVIIGTDDVTVVLNYPVTLVKGQQKNDYTQFVYKSSLKLGKTYDLAVKILNAEIIDQYFDEDSWMRNYSEVKILKHKPYPDVVYGLNAATDVTHNLTFRFAVQGRDRASDINSYLQKDTVKGYCYLSRDKNCYVNVESQICGQRGGNYSENNVFNCTGASLFLVRNGGKTCGVHNSGDSWCIYDGITGPGFDPVGSRHFKGSCVDGEAFYTECQDYREEFCTEPTMNRAICKVNRWQDCASQISKSDCEDLTKRDCFWSDWLVKAKPFRTNNYDYSNKKCLPYIPPGFRFWEGKGEEVCRLANEQNDCPDVHCPRAWIDSAGIYCYFMGDCGNYFNYEKELTMGGYSNSDGTARNYIYSIPLVQTAEYIFHLPLNFKQDLKGGEFTFLQGTDSYMDKQDKDYKKRMDSTEHYSFTLVPPKVEIDVDSLHSAKCSVWQAPVDTDTCSDCHSDPLKPCSEYRCKSISPNCEYAENNGIPTCGFSKPTSTQFNFKIDGLYLLKDTVIPKDALDNPTDSRNIQKKITLQDDLFQEWRGYTVEDMVPYSKLMLVVKADMPINCRVAGLPNTDFSSEPFSHSGFAKEIPLLIDVKSIAQEREDSLVNQQTTSPIEMFNTFQMDNGIKEAQKNSGEDTSKGDENVKDLGSRYEFNFLNTKEALSQTSALYNTDLRNFMSDYKKEMQDIYVAWESNIDYHFIECADATGRFKDRFFISYSLLTDNKPPILLQSDPKKGTIANPPFPLKLDFNEPVECKMETPGLKTAMDCSKTGDIGLYDCNAPVSAGKILNFRCFDQPAIISEYFINVEKGSTNNMSGDFVIVNGDTVTDFTGLELKGSSLRVTDPNALRDETRKITTTADNLNVNMEFPKPKVCKKTDGAEDFDDITTEIKCDAAGTKGVCSFTVPTKDKKTFRILCANDVVMRRNEYAFTLSFS